MTTKRYGWVWLWLWLACVALVPASRSAVIVTPGGGGSGGGGTLTGSVWFPGPFTVSGTNWYLNSVLSNQVMTGISKYATNQLLDIVYTNTTWVYPTDNIVSALSNAANNTRVAIMPGNYQYASRWIFSNSLGQAGINIFGKSNILFEAIVPGSVRIYSTNIGDGFFITNSTRLAFRGINFEGWVVTNYASSTLYTEPGVVWGGFNIYDVSDFEVSNCRFENFHDHGIQGTGANVNWNGASTNRIRIFNNYFANIGSARTNGSVAIDGTAIVPDGPWEIFNNTFYGNLRDIEPYSDGDSAVRPWSGTHIYGNRFINTLDSAILSAGSTNANDVIIDGNYFVREVGWTRRGSNYISSAAGVDWNGGYGWKIQNNHFVGEWTRGVYLYSNARYGEVLNNTFIGITNSGLSTGVPLDIDTGRFYRIEGNKIYNSEGQGVYIHGARDIILRNNSVYNSAAGVGFQIAATGSVISSNVVATGNTSIGNAKGFWDMDFTDLKSIRVYDNDIQGATTDYDFGDTSASELYLSMRGSSSTNRVVRAFEVKDQLVAGANITLTSDANGVTTIAGSGGGSGGTNFPPVISITTNVTVGSGVRQSVTMLTASNQFLNFQGTALNGETVEVAVTNSASTNIQIALNAGGSATTFWNPLVASNDTRFAVPAGTMRIVEFKYSTNNGARWRLNDDIGFTYEIAPGSNITLTTNAGTITIASTGGSAGLSFLGDWWANNVVSNIVGGTLTTNKMNIGGGGGVTGGSINNQARLIPYGGTIRGLIANAGGTFTAGNILFEVFTNDVSTGINLSLAGPYTNATANVNLVAGSFVDIRQSASTNLTPTGTIEVSAQLILQLNP